MLLTNKIQRSLKANKDRDQTFRIWIDPIHSSYPKADEAVEIIANHVLAKVLGKKRPVDLVLTKDSKKTVSIQLCDLLLGAAMSAWRQEATAEAKLEVREHIARHLGWRDLRADTTDEERKFNVWFFHNPVAGVAREARTRTVRLLYPLESKKKK